MPPSFGGATTPERAGGGMTPRPRPFGGMSGLFSHLNLNALHANATRGSKPFSKQEIMQGHRKMGKCAY
jgi:hypothetical protein